MSKLATRELFKGNNGHRSIASNVVGLGGMLVLSRLDKRGLSLGPLDLFLLEF